MCMFLSIYNSIITIHIFYHQQNATQHQQPKYSIVDIGNKTRRFQRPCALMKNKINIKLN